MFNQIVPIGVFIVVLAVSSWVSSKFYYINQENSSLKNTIVVLEERLLVASQNESKLIEALAEQNDKVIKLGEDYNATKKALEAEQAKPDVIRYEKLYKYLPQEVKSNDCEDIKRSVDSLSDFINDSLL